MCSEQPPNNNLWLKLIRPFPTKGKNRILLIHKRHLEVFCFNHLPMCVMCYTITIYALYYNYPQERPKWLEIHSLDELKTKIGHVIVMILIGSSVLFSIHLAIFRVSVLAFKVAFHELNHTLYIICSPHGLTIMKKNTGCTYNIVLNTLPFSQQKSK